MKSSPNPINLTDEPIPELPAERVEADLPDLVELVRARGVGAPLDDAVREVGVADEVEVAQVAPDVLRGVHFN